ncbi:MAG: 50S ribosomal protein L10 [Firmicutes bacterium]|nr:50S ribosomal protein L10 [Bacillota bacterium]
MARPEKKAVVAELKDKLERSRAAVLTDYRGLNVAAMTELRRRMREAEIDYKVVKNTLTRFAARELGVEELEEYLVGPTAIAFSYEDPVLPAKIIVDFAGEYKKLSIKAALLRDKVIQADAVRELAQLPPREILLGQVFAGMQAPIAGLANVLNGVPRNLVYVLDAIREQKEAG